ncbi:MAG: hypothetical protein RIS34_550 [Pseudomonadota bacterium]
MKIRHTLLATLLAASLPGFAAAQSFDCVTNNGACAAAESYLSWSLVGNLFTIANNQTAGGGSFVRNIYFDYNTATMSVANPTSGGGTVAFTAGGTPANLPGAPAGFVADALWTANNPGATYGVNAGESISFAMSGVTLASFTNGSMRVGVHFQGLTNGISEGLVTITSAVPEPESYAMFLAGLGLMGTIARRRNSAKSA